MTEKATQHSNERLMALGRTLLEEKERNVKKNKNRRQFEDNERGKEA
jgi:hypothetical protein